MGLMEDHVIQKGALKRLPVKGNTIARLDGISMMLNRGLAWFASGSLLLMVLVVVFNAILRLFFTPFSGATEIVGWLAAITTAFGLGYTQVNRGYVDIDALVERLPGNIQKMLKRFILLVSMTFFALLAWQLTVYGMNVMKNGNLSETLWLPYYPFIYILALGFTGLTLAILVDLLKEFDGGVGK